MAAHTPSAIDHMNGVETSKEAEIPDEPPISESHANAPKTIEQTTNGHVSNAHSTNGSTSHVPTNLTGKVALVTGASRGIGAGIALELGARGASVVVNYVKGLDGAQSIVSRIEALGSKAVAIQADVSKVPQITWFLRSRKRTSAKSTLCVQIPVWRALTRLRTSRRKDSTWCLDSTFVRNSLLGSMRISTASLGVGSSLCLLLPPG